MINNLNSTGYQPDWKPTCAHVERGSIWIVDTMEPNGKHSDKKMVVISPIKENASKPYVMAIKLHESVTGKPRPSRFAVILNNETYFAVCETMHRVNGDRLIARIGALDEEDLRKLDEGLCYTIGLDGHNLARLVTQDITDELLNSVESETLNAARSSVEQPELSEEIQRISWERDFYKKNYEELLKTLSFGRGYPLPAEYSEPTCSVRPTTYPSPNNSTPPTPASRQESVRAYSPYLEKLQY